MKHRVVGALAVILFMPASIFAWRAVLPKPIPAGTIIMWSGPTDKIPRDWALCDGTNDTPDLRGRFVVGSGGQYETGDTGGESEIIHDHEVLNHAARHLAAGDDYTALTSPSAHDNRPPYYALVFIMKTSR